MAIDDVESVDPRVQYVAAASQVDFDYTFPIFEDADLAIYVDGVLQVLTTDFTVSGAGNNTGGTVTFGTPMTGDEIVTIYRDIPIERISQFAADGPQSSDTFNEEFNRVTMVQQQLQDRLGYAVRFSVLSTVSPSSYELDATVFANKYLGFDADGIPVAVDNTSGILTASDSSITLAKLANIATHTILGNKTALSATPAALTVSEVKTLLALDVTDITGAAALASPTFTGNPVAPTQSPGNNSTRLATTAFVTAADVVAVAAAATYTDSAVSDAIAPAGSVNGSSHSDTLLSGLIIKWGTTASLTATTDNQSTSFPVAFPGGCYTVVISSNQVGGSAQAMSSVHTISASGFQINNSADVAATFSWIAVGH